VKVVTPATADFAPTCVISSAPVIPFARAWVRAESGPPVEKIPSGAATLRPPLGCGAGLLIVRV
jgi:hypothetical protein